MADRFRTVDDVYATVRKSPPQIADIIWDDKPRHLKDLIVLCRDRMPFVAKIQKGTISSYVPGWRSDSSDSRSDSEDEMENLLHVLEVRCRKIIIVHRMQWNRQQAEYLPSEKEIQLPITYKGWFEVLPEDGRAVEYFDSIQSIANVKPKKFLVRTSIVGYHLTNENGPSSWQPLEVKPGDVLTTGIVYMDQKKGKSSMRTFFKRILKSSKHHKKDQELKYLQCFDDQGKEIMVPLIMTGLFSPVGDVSSCNYDAVYELHDLVMAFKLPVKAQLVQDIEQENQTIVPNGMIILKGVQDEEVVGVAKFSTTGDRNAMYEIPADADIRLVKGMTKSRKSQRHREHIEQDEVGSPNTEMLPDPLYMNETSDPMLPMRVKVNKKSKGSGILDKLSVRSKSKKERASLKALQTAGVFSSRLSKSDMNLEDFFQVGDEDENNGGTTAKTDSASNNPKYISEFDSIDQCSNNFQDNSKSASYGMMRQYPVQNRDLPPVPNSTSSPRTGHYSDAVYEELPPAPQPPSSQHHNKLYGSHGDEEDGYMCPAQVKQKMRSENPYGTSGVVRTKPPVAPKENAKQIRARKVRSAIPGNIPDYEEFDSYSNNANRNQIYSSPYRATALAETKRKSSLDERIFNDDQNLETRSMSDWNRTKSRSQKNLNFPANATVRSHNSRRIRNVMDVFNYHDSINDLRQSKEALNSVVPSNVDDYTENEGLRESRSFPTEYVRSASYVLSGDQDTRRYPRSASNSGFSDIYRGNDSAISGDYGFHGDSEFSYSEYSEYIDDGWLPPNDLVGLTVNEVSKSMRYIGMKDRVVIRLANEQIDGNLLCSLDKKLLREGFPELNALEIKKIVDFINGWRPKKK
ncbi:uncharacterized protein LOC134686560 [Mytilus trossulus]|uniref:uncharacterized protein LOC134686560 n=1 Tax=Mytilus trossulus TaxID=6551 RepID=UPI0030051AF9